MEVSIFQPLTFREAQALRKRTTLLAQVLRLVPRRMFNRIVSEQGGDWRVRRLNCWTQFVAMVYAQLSGRRSLRDLEIALRVHQEQLALLRVGEVHRSTLADANAQRPWQIYEELFQRLYQECRQRAPGHGFRFRGPLYVLDASLFEMCLGLFPWAEYQSTKGALKLHAVLDLKGQIPSFVHFTEGAVHEIQCARAMEFEPGSILVFDRGFVDYGWFHYLHLRGVFFVTRLKKGARYRVLERRPVVPGQGITSDQVIVIEGARAKDIPTPLRRIRYRDPETGKVYVFLTNIFHLVASTIAAIYKERWKVETFFRWIKQHLEIKTFLGTNPAAVRTQILIALCIYLLLSYLRFLSSQAFSLHRILNLLQVALADDRPLHELLGVKHSSASKRRAA